jgi:class 3 adenylate cyclase
VITETRYARTDDDVHIAYRVIGDGPVDVVMNVGFVSHVEHMLIEPHIVALFDALEQFSRILVFDRRGVGLSDPVDRAPTLEQQVDDARAVMDAESVASAVVYGYTVGAPFALLFAASEPDRVSKVMISSGFARMTRSDDYPYGNTPEVRAALTKIVADNWGSGVQLATTFPSLAGDPEFRDWGSAFERLASSPGSTRRFLELVGKIDVRPLLGSVHQPVLVMHPTASTFFDAGHAKYLVESLPNARFVDIPGADLTPVQPDARDATIDAISEFLTGERPAHRADRALKTLLFTDIVDSTATAARLGDREWHDLLDRHDAAVERAILAHRGKLVKTTGDGAFASFDGPERAIRCALAINESVAPTGLAVRAGVHTGECEVRGDDLAGIAVHLGARIAAEAEPNETLISQTVKDLVVGSDLTVEPRGPHELKGIPDSWELFAVS